MGRGCRTPPAKRAVCFSGRGGAVRLRGPRDGQLSVSNQRRLEESRHSPRSGWLVSRAEEALCASEARVATS